ncbi:LuxR C-terminal-related transcriptional regulator [Burkholderia multivorans]|uniref:LuxR C-terminal-related transcriptional regulator n=1 Tax=Burkholderia multivorans TaxID=87883 RepID=UPI0009BD221E|nr:LuxR C-terminal-related transcriptional regulator [Burkholderia multivorans]
MKSKLTKVDIEATLKDKDLSRGDFLSRISEFSNLLNFTFWTFGIRHPVPISKPTLIIHSNISDIEYPDHFSERHLKEDAVLRHCYTSTLPLVWNADDASSTPFSQKGLLTQGIRFGWSISMRDVTGTLAWFTLARNTSPVSPDELDENEYSMIWLAYATHSKLHMNPAHEGPKDGRPNLSPREREVMKWTAAGKTAFEIGKILGIAETTCIFHITNATRKLGGVNKTHAIARAALMGLII